MYIFVLALCFNLWASVRAAPPPAVSIEDPASSDILRQQRNQPNLVNTTLSNFENITSLNASSNFPDPYDYVVTPQVLTIEFYNYQGTINNIDLDSCMRKVNDKAMEEVKAGRAQAFMGPDPYTYVGGRATLWLSPGEHLTWSRWSLAPVAIKKFVLENGLRGTQFVLLWRGTEPVGYGQVAMMSETQLSTTTTAPAIKAFPDPFNTHWAAAGLTLEFYGYQGPVSPVALSDCITAASADLRKHISSIMEPMTVAAPFYSYSASDVNLFLTPTEDLLWYMWGFLPILIQEFVRENEFKGTQFIILKDNFGPVGTGHLVQEPTSVLSVPPLDVS